MFEYEETNKSQLIKELKKGEKSGFENNLIEKNYWKLFIKNMLLNNGF